MVGMMEDIMKGFGVESALAEKASAFLNSVFGYLMEDNMAVVQKLVETFGGEDMSGELKIRFNLKEFYFRICTSISGMNADGMLSMYRQNFLQNAEEYDGYIQKAKASTCKEKFTLAKAFRKFK